MVIRLVPRKNKTTEPGVKAALDEDDLPVDQEPMEHHRFTWFQILKTRSVAKAELLKAKLHEAFASAHWQHYAKSGYYVIWTTEAFMPLGLRLAEEVRNGGPQDTRSARQD